LKSNLDAAHAYTGLKKDHGPPHKFFNKQFDPIDKNELLLEKGVDIEALRSIHGRKEGIQTA
jgi:hypothetical protein